MDNLILFLILGEQVDNFNKDMQTLNQSNGNARYKKMTFSFYFWIYFLWLFYIHTPFIRLYVYKFLKSFFHVLVLNFVELFFFPEYMEMIMYIFLFCLLVCWITLTNIWMLNQPCIFIVYFTLAIKYYLFNIFLVCIGGYFIAVLHLYLWEKLVYNFVLMPLSVFAVRVLLAS